MDFYFPVETDPQTVLEVLRFWRMEYRVDGFVLMGDGVWMELLARDAVLADVKLIGCGYDMSAIARKLGGKKTSGSLSQRISECDAPVPAR